MHPDGVLEMKWFGPWKMSILVLVPFSAVVYWPFN
jgi:hypothetical protein